MQRGVQHGNRVDERQPPSNVRDSPEDRRGAQAPASRHLAFLQFRAPDGDSDDVRDSALSRESHFDWIAWWQVKSMKPPRRPTAKDSPLWKAALGGDERHHRAVREPTPRVYANPNAPPARAAELVPGHAVGPSLLEVERPACEFDWNSRSPRNDPGSWSRG